MHSKSSIKIFLILKIVTRNKILKKETFKEDENKIILDSKILEFKEFLFQRSQCLKNQHSKQSTFKKVNIQRGHKSGIIENSRITIS